MKHNRNHDNARAAGLQLVPVRFEFTHPTATSVCVAGSFNQWRPEAKTLHPEGGGRWHKETVLAPGTYEYCLVVDARPAGQRISPQPVWREKLGPERGHAGSGSSRRRAQSTNAKLKQIENRNENMNKQTQAVSNDMGQLAEDAQALMAATADVAGEKVKEARNRLAAALERGKEICGRAREKVVQGAKAADEAVHEHPYQAIAIGVAVGAIIGYLMARRCCRNRD
jgi:ElaB/YqjD/DUF883 family membrane-anchored ribosome-binding protein